MLLFLLHIILRIQYLADHAFVYETLYITFCLINSVYHTLYIELYTQ